MGEISYSLYLWHWPIWVFMNYLQPVTSTVKLFCIALTFNLAYISTKEIENPIRNKKRVSTAALWRGFKVLWLAFMAGLLVNLVLGLGGSPEEGIDFKRKTVFQEPKYDFEGYLLENSYASIG